MMFKRRKKRIEELTEYLEEVNVLGTARILQTREDEFSILQDEIYKTVTALCQTKEEALMAKRNYADHLADIAHQLKTPITAALCSLQLLKEKEPSVYADQAVRQLKRLHELGEALLMISGIDSGALRLEHRPVDVYTLLNLAADHLLWLAEEKCVKIQIEEAGAAAFTGDLEWSMEACLNLMKNCLEHSPAYGTVACGYAQNPLYTEIWIRDEGDGFEKEDLLHAFDRFYRGKHAKDGGIGIGLALAKSVIEMQNGTVTARNLPDKGACFEIRMYCH